MSEIREPRIHANAESLLGRLRELSGDQRNGWQLFGRDDWPRLFPLLALAADLPRFDGHGRWPSSLRAYGLSSTPSPLTSFNCNG